MNELDELYQQVILDHNKHPHNCHVLDDANQQAEGFNPLCGDELTLYLHVDADKIIAASFVGNGCAISTASASLLTDAVRGKTIAEAKQLFEQFRLLVTQEEAKTEELGKLAVLAGVKKFPMRVKCATLAWHTLMAALNNQESTTSE